MSLSSRTIKTPQPGVRSLIVDVSESNFVSSGGSVPPEGTLYGSALFKTFFGADYRGPGFEDYVYVDQGPDNKNGGTLLFAKDKTEAEANVPFRTVIRVDGHYWHPVLLALIPVLVEGFPLSTQDGVNTVNAARYVMRERYIPGVSEGTRFKDEYYFGPRPFNIKQRPVPIPSSVSYDIVSRLGGFPECLHKRITIPPLTTTPGNSIPGQVFEATNFEEWSPYVLSDHQELVEGGYFRKKTTVYPPIPPEEITRLVR